jgi:DNA modification methylase
MANSEIIGAGQDTARPAPKINTITCGDCLDILPLIPDKSVDFVLTDPPYCSGGFTEQARRSSNGSGLRSETRAKITWFQADNMGTNGLVFLLRNVACECLRILKDNSSLCVFTDWRMIPAIAPAIESAGFRWQNMVVWNKGCAGIGRGFRATHEIILQFTNGVPRIYSAKEGNVLTEPKISAYNRIHHTEKPIALLERICRVLTTDGDVVLDPFSGSGATGVACSNLSRNYMLIEKNPEYCKKAEERIHALIRPAQNTTEICHTAPNTRSLTNAQLAMDL